MIANRWVANGATGLLAVCAVAMAAVTVRREVMLARSGSPAAPLVIQEDWASYADRGHVMGSADAPVTIVEFSDFQCPFCARFASYVDSLRALGENIRVLYRHLPGSLHEFAVPAVRASECAAEAGNFDPMHAALFAHSDSLGIAPWWWFARIAGVQDSVKFDRCMRRTDPIPALVADTAAARRLGATGTPTLLILELRPRGLPTFDSLRAYIQRVKPRGSDGRLSAMDRVVSSVDGNGWMGVEDVEARMSQVT